MQERPNITKKKPEESKEHPSHLNEGIKPIMASLIAMPETPEDEQWFQKEILPMVKEFESLKDAKNIDWGYGKATSQHQGFSSPGRATYVISTIDSFNKFSEGFMRCTGLVVTGIDKKTKKNISFLTHQDPTRFLHGFRDEFTEDLRVHLENIKKRSVPGTIDAVIVGGRYFIDEADRNNEASVEDYPKSEKLLGTEVKNILGFKPMVINGPKTMPHEVDNVYYDNNNRRMYLIRPKINTNPEGEVTSMDFPASEFDTQKHKYE